MMLQNPISKLSVKYNNSHPLLPPMRTLIKYSLSIAKGRCYVVTAHRSAKQQIFVLMAKALVEIPRI